MEFDSDNNLKFKSREKSAEDMRKIAAGYKSSAVLIEEEIERVKRTKEITNSRLAELYRIRRQILSDYAEIVNYYKQVN